MFHDRAITSFYSNAVYPYHQLSNFAYAPILFTKASITPSIEKINPEWKNWIPAAGVTFPSVEHAWQALKATSPKAFKMFIDGGILTKMEPDSFLPFVHGKNVMERALAKFKHWSKKQNIGILAKFAANPKYEKALGLEPGEMDYTREWLDPQEEQSIWNILHSCKFVQHPSLAHILLETKNNYLLEFDRGAAKVDKRVHWGGHIANGVLHGENAMGKYLMLMRQQLMILK